MLGMAFGRIGRDSIFIQEIGANQLPLIYIFNAFLMVALTIIYTRTYDLFSRGTFLIGLLLIASTITAGLRYALNLEGRYIYYAVYVLTEAVILTIPMHFWTFANEVFDPREGKRIFPLIGGAGLIGTISGGVLTGIFANQIGTKNLLIVWMIIMLLTIPIIIKFRMIYGRISAEGRGQADTEGLSRNLTHIWGMPLVRTLTYIAVPMWLTVYVLDFQFFLAIEESFQTKNQTSTALGVVHGITSGAGLLFQLFLTRPLIKKLGIGRAVMVFPGGMVLGSLAFFFRLFIPTGAQGILNTRMLPAIFARMTDESVLPSIGETSIQLLYNSIADEWRGRARAFISGIVEPMSIALAGVLLIAFTASNLPTYLLPFLSLILGLAWLRLTMRVRGDYMDALVNNLNSHSIDMQDQALTELAMRKDPQAVKMLEKSLFSKKEEVSLMAVEILTNDGNPEILNRLAHDIPNVPATNVKVHILKVLRDLKAVECYPVILPLLKSKNKEVKSAAIRSIGILAEDKSTRILGPFLYSKSPAIRDEALIALLRIRKRLDKRNKAVIELRKMIESNRSSIRIRTANIIQRSGKRQLRHELVELAKTNNPGVQKAAIRALGYVGDAKNVAFLTIFFNDSELKYYAMEAIEKIGEPSVVPLLRLLKHSDDDRKQNILTCLGKIDNGMAVAPLAKLLGGESIEVEDKALEALARIHMKQVSKDSRGQMIDEWFTPDILKIITRGMDRLAYTINERTRQIRLLENLPESDAKWLILDAMKRSYKRKEHAALLYLELLADPAAIRAATVDLHGSDSRACAEAIELIEGSGEEGAKLAKTFESVYFPRGQSIDIVPSETELQIIFSEQMLTKEKPWLYASILFGMGEYDLTELKPQVHNFIKDKNPMVHANALIAYQKLGGNLNNKQKREVKKMAVNMERMLFLRSVPLFSEVDGDDIYWINEITREANYAEGEIIFHENDKGDALYIIVSGDVRIIKEGKKRITLDVFGKRDCFGEMSILDQEPRSATTQAANNTRLLVIMRDDFQRLVLARPQIGFSLFRTLSRRLRQLTARLKEVEARS